jgi:hypothetical protein
MGATGTVINFGTIQGLRKAGVGLYSGGTVANGSTTDTRARIDGYDTGVRVSGASGSVTNFGTIAAHNPGPTKSIGVYFDHGGGLTNGSTTDRAASISGAIGVYAQTLSSVNGATTIVNFATIVGQYGAAVDLTAGGNVTNGAVTDTVAAIDGRIGILFLASQATVTNFGTVQGDGLGGNSGVYFGYGGQMANGTAKDTNALVTGYSGVVSNGIASIVNFGIIDGVGAAATAGVLLNSGGALTNGSLLDAQARIEGYAGVRVSATGAAIANFGTIQGDGYAGNAGVYLSGGGTVTNGAVTDSIARIDGYSGISAAVTRATIINLGIIQGVGLTSQAGVVLGAGGKIVNGSAKSNKAVIEGYNGLLVSGVATVTNFGTIIGDGGTALQFKSTKDRLIVEAGSTTIGAVKGGGGTMELAAGTGTITGLGGSMSGFAAYIIDTGGSWSLTGTNTLTGAEALTINGTLVNLGGLSLGATVTNAGVLEASTGVLTVNGPLSGAGLCEVAGGRLAFTSTFNGGVTFTTGSTGTLELAHGQTFSGTLTGFSMTGSTFLDLDDINFTAGSTKAVYSGNTAGGVLTVTDGAHTASIHFTGDYTGSAWVVSSDGHGGVIIHDPPGTPNAALAAGGAKSPSTGLPTLALIHAMAAAPTGADVSIASRQPREETPLLFLAHGTHIA